MNSPSEPTPETVAAYDQFADDYLLARQDRRVMARHYDRFLALLFGSWTSDRPPRVADVGCGPGFDAAFLRQHGARVVGLDLSWRMMLTGRADYPGDFVQADMRFLPMSGAFDGLWVNASLLHLPRPEVPSALAEFARVLKPNGLLFLSMKQGDGAEWVTGAYGRSEARYFVYWREAEFDQALAAAGFRVVDGWADPKGDLPWLARFAQKER